MLIYGIVKLFHTNFSPCISMLTINNLSISVDNKHIINNLSLQCAAGSIHALMGPNGSGKSTLAYSLLGHPKYQVTQGSVLLNATELFQLSTDKRARAGLFVAFQYPQEIPGVSLLTFLQEAHRALTGTSLNTAAFKDLLYKTLETLQLDHSFIYRDLNDGFSGGEKKRFELLQLLLFKPRVAILDEIDSGLDVDAIKLVAHGIHQARQENPELALILITHYRRILDYVKPDHVHIIQNGTLIRSGNQALIELVETKGYDAFAR